MKTILAVDQGFSTTRVAICNLQGVMLGVGIAQGASQTYVGIEAAMQAVREAAERAAQQAGVPLTDIEYIYGGFSGADWPFEYQLLKDGLLKLGLCEQVHVSNDSIIAMRAGTERPYGVILIAGSGGNCAVRSPDGEEFIYSYYHDPDLQGGTAIGQRAIINVFRSHTGREPETVLTKQILEHYKYATVDDLCRAFFAGEVTNMHHLSPLVFHAAYQGDEVATNILRDMGRGYAELASAALRRFKMNRLPVEVVTAGGVFKGIGNTFINSLASNLRTSTPLARLVQSRFEPLVGAYLLALEAAKISIDETVRENLETSAGNLQLIRNV